MRAACRRASVVAVPLTTTSSSSSSRPTRHCSTQTCGPHAAADREPDLRARPTTSAGARAPRDAPHDEAPREGVQACQEAEQVQEDLLVVVQEDAQEAVVFERHCFLECVALQLQPPSPVNGTHSTALIKGAHALCFCRLYSSQRAARHQVFVLRLVATLLVGIDHGAGRQEAKTETQALGRRER